MALPQFEVMDLETSVDSLYSDDLVFREQLRQDWGVTNLSLTKEQFEEAISVLRTIGAEFISTQTVSQANDFVAAFNTYAEYMRM